MIEGTGAVYKTININLKTIIKHDNLIIPFVLMCDMGI